MSDRFIWRQKSEALAAVMDMLGGYVPAAKTAAADVRSVAARGATAVLMDPETGALDAALSAAPEMLACTLAASNGSLVGLFLAGVGCTAKVLGQKYMARATSSASPGTTPAMEAAAEKLRTGMAAVPLPTTDELAKPPMVDSGPVRRQRPKARVGPY